jgi:hypothetical protein
MSRRKFDLVLSLIGVVITVVLVVGGCLAFWGYSFANNKVRDELTAQQIDFPPAGSDAITGLPAADQAAISRYAGQPLVNGQQARAYADHFIAVHLKDVADGKTYSQVSEEWIQGGMKDATLAQQRETLFMGETLRGLLLNAYGYWQFGQLALIAAVVMWVMGAIMLVLTVLGFWHLGRVEPEVRVLEPTIAAEPATTSV